MSDYVYLATRIEDGAPVAGFALKHQLERWAWREDAGPERPLDEWCRLWRISSFPYAGHCQVVELELKNDRLLKKKSAE